MMRIFPKKTYEITVKSHADYPDYIGTCLATSKMEAAKIFASRLNHNSDRDFKPKDLIKWIKEENE